MPFTKLGSEIWRDYATDGVPASGAHKISKPDMRAWMLEVEGRIVDNIGVNLLINGDFRVNQRAYAGGTLAIGAFGHDRWKAGVDALAYTVSGDVVNLAGGWLTQVIELGMMYSTHLASTPITVSVDSPSVDMHVVVGNSSTGVITAGSGRRHATVTTAAGDTGHLPVFLKAATPQSVTFARVKAEIGTVQTPWRARTKAEEERLSQRYYYDTSAEIVGSGLTLDGYSGNTNSYNTQLVPLPAQMRATPTLTTSGTFTPTNVSAADTPFVGITSINQLLLRARANAVGRLFVACSSGARLRVSAEL